jgi:hypothetical protein
MLWIFDIFDTIRLVISYDTIRLVIFYLVFM